jgi:2'-5' RNA ligase
LRLFFALWADAGVAQQFAALSSQFKFEHAGRLVDSKNYHVTVAFVGEVSNSRLETLRKIGWTLQARPFSMRFDALEYWQESRAIVAVVSDTPPALRDLWQGLQSAIGLKTDMPFRPHVTLARKVAQATVHTAKSAIIWDAGKLSLIRSDTGGVESAYTVVDTWPLLYES